MGSRKLPISGRALARPRFGLAPILDKSNRVADAFGARLGFIVIVLGILAWAVVALAAIKTFGGKPFLW